MRVCFKMVINVYILLFCCKSFSFCDVDTFDCHVGPLYSLGGAPQKMDFFHSGIFITKRWQHNDMCVLSVFANFCEKIYTSSTSTGVHLFGN